MCDKLHLNPCFPCIAEYKIFGIEIWDNIKHKNGIAFGHSGGN